MIRAAALVLLLAGGAHAKEKKPAMEWKGSMGGTRAGARAIADAKAWAALWKTLGKEAPAADFAKYAAVYVAAGERPTGGWGIELLEPVAAKDDLIVRWRVTKPKGFAIQAFTSPWKAKLYAKPKGKIVVEPAAE